MPGPSSKKVEIKTAEELFPSRNQYSAIDRSLSEVEIEDLRSKLNMYGNTVGFTWLLSPSQYNFTHGQLADDNLSILISHIQIENILLVLSLMVL